MKRTQYRNIPAQIVQVGQVVMSQGYAWQVTAVHIGTDQIILICDNVARPDGAPDMAPIGYARDMSLGFAPGVNALVCL
jgi:hypothetical protein